MLKIIFTLFILMGFLQVAQAVVPGGGSPGGINDCANGIKVKGNFDFDGTTSLRYCNGYGFDSLDGGLNVSLPCTKIAQVRYYAGSMQTCDGSYWHTMDGNTTTTTCAYAGAMISATAGFPAYCDGSYWHIMLNSGGSPIILCRDFNVQKHCVNAAGCFWNAGFCYEPNDCSFRTSVNSCNANPNCEWANGACGSAY